MKILSEAKELSTGIFWYDTDNDKLIVIDVPYDLEDNIQNDIVFNSKSGNTFNHEKSWEDIKQFNRIYRHHSYRYYPRGRVIVKNGKVDVYYNQNLDTDHMKSKIILQFGLSIVKDSIRWMIDGSDHYNCYLDDDSIK